MSGHAASDRAWAANAIAQLHREAARSADTHLLHMRFDGFPGIDFYFKDEAAHPTGSLKHRLARSLFLYALCNGRLRPGQSVVDASSGSTAISEAWFARLLGLPFVAVMPACTAPGKIRDVQSLGARCDLVDDPAQVHARAAWHAERGACHLDQFGLAERATDWRGNNNIAESIFGQLALEEHPVPSWIVVGAGTGGTSATIGRYLRYHRHNTQLAVVDPENSAFYPGWLESRGAAAGGPRSDTADPAAQDQGTAVGQPSRIEGIGRARLEPSFVPAVIDHMIPVPDGASVAAMRHLHEHAGLQAGPSTGTNLWGVWQLIAEMVAEGCRGSVVSLICDGADRYAGNYYNPDWLRSQGLDPAPYEETLRQFFASGTWPS